MDQTHSRMLEVICVNAEVMADSQLPGWAREKLAYVNRELAQLYLEFLDMDRILRRYLGDGDREAEAWRG